MCLTGAVSVAWCSDFTPRLHIPFVKMHITAGAVPYLPSRALITTNALQPWPLKGGERQLDWWPVPGVFLPLTSDLWERPQLLNRDSRVYNAIYFFLIRPYNPPAQEKKSIIQAQRSQIHLHSCLYYFRRFDEAKSVSCDRAPLHWLSTVSRTPISFP